MTMLEGRPGGEMMTDRTQPPIRPFDMSLPMLLMNAREAVMRHFRQHLRQHDITEQQWRVLRVLAEGGMVEMLDLATRTSILAPSLSRMIPLLAARGLVRRHTHQADQRRILVDLTAKGQALFRTMAAESIDIYAVIEARIGKARMQDVYAALRTVIEALDAPGPD